MIGTISLTDVFSSRMTSSVLYSVLCGNIQSTADYYRKADVDPISVPWKYVSPVEREKSSCRSTEVFFSRWETGFTPRTELGKRLYALRAKAVSSGMKLLSEEEVLEEVKRRRGEI